MVAKPDQWPEPPRNAAAQKHDGLSKQRQQHSDESDRTGVAGANQLGSGISNTGSETGKKICGPAHAEPVQSAAMQQEERDDRKCDEEQPGVESLGRQSRDQERQQQQRGQQKCHIDPPTLRLRVKSVDELGEFRLHERPARADDVAGVLRKASVAVLALPDRIDQQEIDRRNNREPQQQRTGDGQQDVTRRIQQARAYKSRKAGGLDRRGALGNQLLANECRRRLVAHVPRLLLMRHP